MEKHLVFLLIVPLFAVFCPFSTHCPPSLPFIYVSSNLLCQIMTHRGIEHRSLGSGASSTLRACILDNDTGTNYYYMTLTQAQLNLDYEFSLVFSLTPVLSQSPSPAVPWVPVQLPCHAILPPWFTQVIMISLRNPIQALSTLPIPGSPCCCP